MKIYIIHLIKSTNEDNRFDVRPTSVSTSFECQSECACFLTISDPTMRSRGCNTNTLPVIHNLLESVRAKTDIPLQESILDTSLSLIPYEFILSGTTTTAENLISITDARRLGLFSESMNVLVDLKLGNFLGQLHSKVQNDWFGVPRLKEPTDPSYSWQETFTELLENLMLSFEKGNIKVDFEIPYEQIRFYHSRAIGFSLFDDVEVPSLIWLTGSEDDILVSKPMNPDDPWSFEIRTILPVVTHALWGDPLLESFFIPPNPTKVMEEGYISGGGGALAIFPRQNTKRIWYNLFLALLVLHEIRDQGDEDERKRRAWCKRTILSSVDALREAPNY